MVGGMLRHMSSLRSMRRDNGWIHTLLEEAENERMHLLTFLELRQPGRVFRALVLISQVSQLSNQYYYPWYSPSLLGTLPLSFFFIFLLYSDSTCSLSCASVQPAPFLNWLV